MLFLRAIVALLLPFVHIACNVAGSGTHGAEPSRAVSGSGVVEGANVAVPGADTVRLRMLKGSFHETTTPASRGNREQFELSLQEEPPGEGTQTYHVGFARYGAGRPEIGRYPLGVLNRADPGGRFYATYRHTSSDSSQAFVSVAGELVITSSTPEQVAGAFRFTGAEYYANWPPTGRRVSGSPDRVEPDAPTVEVVGSFAATPMEIEVVCVGTGGPSVVVEVRDELGRPAAIGTSIVIQDGAFRDSADGSHPVDELRVGAGERRPGRYEVRLTKPGYQPVILHDVQAPATGSPRCSYAEPTDMRRVTLELLPNAPPVRSIIVFPPSIGLGLPELEVQMRAAVDAAPGVLRTVRWSSSDTTVATISPSGMLRSRCRHSTGEAVITATSVADPSVRGVASVTVWPARETRGLDPDVKAKVDACLGRFGYVR